MHDSPMIVRAPGCSCLLHFGHAVGITISTDTASGRRLNFTSKETSTAGAGSASKPTQTERVGSAHDLTRSTSSSCGPTREILENAHCRGWHYIVHRAGQPMIAILDHERVGYCRPRSSVITRR